MATDDRVNKSIKHGGRREGAGRKAGVPNKVTASMKEAVSKAFDELGGWKWLVEVGKEDPRVVIPLFRQLMPKQIALQAGITHKLDPIADMMAGLNSTHKPPCERN